MCESVRIMISPPNIGSGSMKILKLKFPKNTSYNGEVNIVVQILNQVHKQCHKQIPAFVLEPLQKTAKELEVISRQNSKRYVVTHLKRLIVIHADSVWTFGNRYVLESDVDGSSIDLAVTGSDRLHDLFINVSESGNVLMSYKGSEKISPNRKKSLVELQLSIITSTGIDSIYTYYHTIRNDYLKKGELNSLKKLELKINRLSLSPKARVLTANGRVRKIMANGFQKMFGVVLLESTTIANNRNKRDLKFIHNSYRRLSSYINGDRTYDEGIKIRDFRRVSKKSILDKILAQFRSGRMNLPLVVIVKINDLVGNGLVAGQYIAPGTIIGEYSGSIVKVIPITTNEQMDNTYFAPYSVDEVPGSEMFVIDAKSVGNPTRFINHSADNSNAVWTPIFDGEKFRLIIIAIRAIPEGKQILLKYRASYWSNPLLPNPIPTS